MTHNSKSLDTTSNWGAVAAMALGAFVLVASEFLPVSLLTPISNDLSISEGSVGQAISVSGFFAVITSLSLSSLIGNLNRKLVLLFLTALMVVSSAIVALMPSYGAIMVGRVFLGIAIGGSWSMSTATAMRLVPEAAVPKALAIINGGSALAATVAAPLGSILGGLIGWRGAFICVIPVTIVVLIWQALTLPTLPAITRTSNSSALKLLVSKQTALGMASILLLFAGQFSLFTYLRPFLEGATHVGLSTLSILLLTVGIAGFVGTTLVGMVLNRSLNGFLAITPFLMALIAAALVAFGESLAATTVLLAAWGLISTPAPVGWGTWIARALPRDAEAGGGLMVATIQLGIALGATAGGMLLDAEGYRATFALSALLLVAASIFAIVAARAGRPPDATV